LHPVQLYQSGLNLLLLVGGYLLYRRNGRPGFVFGVMAIAYSTLRFGVELYRGDTDRGMWFSDAMSTSQVIAVFWAAIGLFALLTLNRDIWAGGESKQGK